MAVENEKPDKAFLMKQKPQIPWRVYTWLLQQPFPKYLTQTLVLCEIAHYGKSSISFFQQFFANFDKILILGGRLGTK